MRTTISIDEDLLAQLKQHAAEAGSTVSRLIEDSARQMLFRQRQVVEEQPSFELVTFGRGGKFTQHDVDKTARLLELEDAERFGRREP